MKKYSVTSRELALSGLFSALLMVLSQVAIPLPSGVPVTLQTFAVALAGYGLGARLGTLSVAAYLLLGAMGLPVFAGLHGGVGVFAGPTGGFLLGFLPMAALCGASRRREAPPGRIFLVLLGALGLGACHLLGTAQFSLVTGTPVFRALALVSLPFLAKDALSVAVAYFAAAAVRRGLRAARLG